MPTSKKSAHLYVAIKMLWRTKEERYVQPGEKVDLSDLEPETIQLLLDNKAIRPDIAEVKESNNGEIHG